MKIQLPDYHIHTTLCNHAYGEMEDYVERAIEIGLPEIGFSEHMPVMPEPHLCISYDDLPFYIDRVKKLRDRYSGRISIKLGGEMDMELDRTDEIESIIETYEFDYIIGSIHYLDGWPFDQVQYKHKFEEENLDDIYGRFFDNIIRAAKSGLYDVAGHIDNLKRMGYHPEGDMTENYERVAGVLKEMDVAFEINTSGYDYPAGEAYPSPQFLKIMNKCGVPVTIGSDSHKPGHIGRHFDKAVDVLKEAGYDRVAYFEGRNRILKPF
jgi:histidinol-phosphatase (PHP family)